MKEAPLHLITVEQARALIVDEILRRVPMAAVTADGTVFVQDEDVRALVARVFGEKV